MSREVLRDAIIYLPAKVVPAMVGVLAIPILTRLLTPAQYGEYLLAMTSLTLIAALCISWLVSITIRFNVVYGVKSLFNYSKPYLLYSILIACFAWVAASQCLAGSLQNRLFTIAGLLWLITHGAYEYFSGWLRARNFAKAYSIAVSWRSISGLLLAIFMLVLLDNGPSGVLLGYSGAMLIGLILLTKKALHTEGCDAHCSLMKSELSEILRYGLPAAFINLVTIGLSLADRYIINSQLGPEPVAVYGASYDIAEKTVFFANSMLLLSSSVIGFRIFEKEGEAQAVDFLARLMRLYLLAAPPLVLALAILSQDIVSLLLPDQYQVGARILPIVATAGLFVGIMHRYSLLLSFHKRTDIIMWCSIGALIVNLISCFFLIPRYGIIGAAVSTALAYLSWLLLIRLSAMKYYGPRFPWLTFVRVCGALVTLSVSMLAALRLDSFDRFFVILTSLTFGMVVYAFSLYLFREITQKDVQALLSVFNSKFRKGQSDGR